MDKSVRFAIRLVHLNDGWRYWVFERRTGEDVGVGFSAGGYATRQEALDALARVAP